MSLTPVNHPLGTPFIELQSIDSTNNYALTQIHANLAQPGTCYFAHEQTAGKGQRGKSWATEKGSNIILSLVLKPFFLQPFQQFQLSTCVAVATHWLFSKHAGHELRIKWPNDLYWKDQKLGGILIENIIGADDGSEKAKEGPLFASDNSLFANPPSANWKWSIIGIGINVNQSKFPDDLKNPVSLSQITGKNFNPVQLSKEICATIDLFYKRLLNEGIYPLLELYNRALYKKNEIVHFKKGTRNFQATVKSVDEKGRLTIQHFIEEKINFGEVEWVIAGR